MLAEAKRQIMENGYANTTIRSVAGACGLGVGTVYNYFQSKDMLIASFMLDDWMTCIREMQNASPNCPEEVLHGVYRSLHNYIDKYQSLFTDADALKAFSTAFTQRHNQLRGQLVGIIRPVCESAQVENREFLAEFIAESMLTWTVAGKTYDELAPVLGLLLKSKQ